MCGSFRKWPFLAFFVDLKARSFWIVDAIINIIILVAISMCVHREPIIRGQFVLFVKKEQIRLRSSTLMKNPTFLDNAYVELSGFLFMVKNLLQICIVELTITWKVHTIVSMPIVKLWHNHTSCGKYTNSDWSICTSWCKTYASWGINWPIRIYLTLRYVVFASWGMNMPQSLQWAFSIH